MGACEIRISIPCSLFSWRETQRRHNARLSISLQFPGPQFQSPHIPLGGGVSVLFGQGGFCTVVRAADAGNQSQVASIGFCIYAYLSFPSESPPKAVFVVCLCHHSSSTMTRKFVYGGALVAFIASRLETYYLCSLSY